LFLLVLNLLLHVHDDDDALHHVHDDVHDDAHVFLRVDVVL